MPRKPPTNVIEHRISLSDFERSRLKEYMQTQKLHSNITSASAIIQGVSWPLVALAALWYVQFSLEDLWDAINNFIDNTSTKITTKLEKDGYVNYEADEYGREVVKIQNEMEDLWLEIQIVGNNQLPTFNEARAKQIYSRMDVLSKREKVLRSIIHKIAEGEISGYTWSAAVGAPGRREEVFREALSEQYEEEWRRLYGEEIDVQDTIWDIELGEDQSIADEDIEGYTA